jgi:BlaI family penicillinase repressor
MKNKTKQNKPTAAELEILSIIWERETATVREVHEILNQRSKPTGYTTVLKMLQIMDGKNLVERTFIGRKSSKTTRANKCCAT